MNAPHLGPHVIATLRTGVGVMSIALGQPIVRNTDRLFFTGMALALALALFLGFFAELFQSE
jgi:hypothetical protein